MQNRRFTPSIGNVVQAVCGRVSNSLFSEGGGMVPPLGGGLGQVGGECRVKHHDNRIEEYCVFNGYLKSDIQLKDIL